MIPKKIHYCWFGRGKMPELAQKCIASWKKHLPEYEIKEWNEDNFDLDMYPYVREAYDNRKFAFVTDVVRLYALYHEGGVYMDTDVEVLKPLDAFLHHPAFSGFEDDTHIPTGIMASEKHGAWAKWQLEYYTDKHFLKEDGTMDMTTNVIIIGNSMAERGFVMQNSLQDFEGMITIYPKDYFCPKSHVDGRIYFTDNTYTIHHFAASWVPRKARYADKLRKYIGDRYYLWLLNFKRSLLGQSHVESL